VILYTRPIRFEEVDAARILFFARYLNFAHEAMERFFDGLEGGYATLITKRQVGLPAVDVKMRFFAPVRYGDTLQIETSTQKLGTRSAVLLYRMRLGDTVAAEVEHTVVTTDLARMTSVEMPADVRDIFSEHLIRPAP
jgi:4-hydroxybenzoyl-CoA thioesterase